MKERKRENVFVYTLECILILTQTHHILMLFKGIKSENLLVVAKKEKGGFGYENSTKQNRRFSHS